MKKSNPEEMVALGLHLGHKSKKIHPKAREYVYKVEKGVCLIDLYQTAKQLDAATEFAYDLGINGKKILFVSTKRHIRNLIGDLCRETNINYLTEKWVGGFLTNFDEISKNIKKLNDFKSQKEDGVWGKLPKHEMIALEKKLARIEKLYTGVANLETLPDALYIVDIKREETAAREARDRNIKTIAIVDTNCDPTLVDFPIVANDDSIQSIEYISKKIAGAYDEGRKKAPKPEKKI